MSFNHDMRFAGGVNPFYIFFANFFAAFRPANFGHPDFTIPGNSREAFWAVARFIVGASRKKRQSYFSDFSDKGRRGTGNGGAKAGQKKRTFLQQFQ